LHAAALLGLERSNTDPATMIKANVKGMMTRPPRSCSPSTPRHPNNPQSVAGVVVADLDYHDLAVVGAQRRVRDRGFEMEM
jgi:hypothetical protein